jgi:DNA-binding transcriptional ArsR family regulator
MKNVSEEIPVMKMGLTEICYGFFSTLANPTRLAIIEKLEEKPMSVNELVGALNQEQSMVSHNLRPLVECKLVHVRREGKNRVYRLNTETITPLLSTVERHYIRYCGEGVNCPHKTSETS